MAPSSYMYLAVSLPLYPKFRGFLSQKKFGIIFYLRLLLDFLADNFAYSVENLFRILNKQPPIFLAGVSLDPNHPLHVVVKTTSFPFLLVFLFSVGRQQKILWAAANMYIFRLSAVWANNNTVCTIPQSERYHSPVCPVP
jgi:hypothetical protein